MFYGVEFKFEINLGSIFSLLIGICCGVILLFLVYVLTTLKKVDEKRIIVSTEVSKITSEDIKNDIDEAKKRFLDMRKEEKQISWNNIKSVCSDLVTKIASRFYPKSKQPIAELTMEELILLDRYIMDQLESLLDKVGIKMFKNLKLSTILKLLNVKNDVENNVVVKASKKMKLDKIINVGMTLLNVLNPATWFKKLVFNPAITQITKSICLMLISIIGQETYHVYSKQAFMDPYSDEELDNLIRLMHEQQVSDEDVKAIEEQDYTVPPSKEELKAEEDIKVLNLLMDQTKEYQQEIVPKKQKKKKIKVKN